MKSYCVIFHIWEIAHTMGYTRRLHECLRIPSLILACNKFDYAQALNILYFYDLECEQNGIKNLWKIMFRWQDNFKQHRIPILMGKSQKNIFPI